MRICATYGTKIPFDDRADMQEIRLDVFDSISYGIDDKSIITLCGNDISCVPDSFKGLVDIGDNNVHTSHRTIRSIHDFDKTPTSEEIVRMLSEGEHEVSKGAFAAFSFKDLYSVLNASKSLERRHVLLCMGEIGRITRIRQNILHNEFTFGYVGKPTAPGQLSYDELKRIGDDCIITGIIGHPLYHSRSPMMQNAAISAAGINGIYLTFDSPDLDDVEDVIRGYDIRGVNVTIPYKQSIMDHIDKISPEAERIGAVNTVINDDGELIGENTDIIGISDAMKDVDLKDQNVLIMGSGGAARAAAYVFTESGCSVSISGRNRDTVKDICNDFGTDIFSGDTEHYDIIVNCTPIGIVKENYPADVSHLRPNQTIFDMVYGMITPLISSAMKNGCRIIDGKDMLIDQGTASFRLWFGKEPDRDVMRGAL